MLDRDQVFGHLDFSLRSYFECNSKVLGRFTIDLNEEPVTIGRNKKCSVVLDDESISWEHAQVFCDGEEYYIEDLGSTNGIRLNNVKIVKSVLHHLDHVRIGETELVFMGNGVGHRRS
ncbi:MAG: FHA domain-containing protein [Bdellovibrionales bacterium]|nr:FHA domain-containing protein [Bdellovibrionales bacterium]